MKDNGKIRKLIQSQRGIIYFSVIVVVAHFLWKFLFVEDEQATLITLLGWDVSLPFNLVANHIAMITHKFLNILGYETTLASCNIVQHTGYSQQGVQVVWGCTGIKQGYIFTCIIAFYRGSYKDKLWYIPLGLLVIYLFNIFRIVLISAIIKHHPEQFDLWHEYIMKYLFYIIIFAMWVIWDRHTATKEQNIDIYSN